jgi:hypothetical protein
MGRLELSRVVAQVLMLKKSRCDVREEAGLYSGLYWEVATVFRARIILPINQRNGAIIRRFCLKR